MRLKGLDFLKVRAIVASPYFGLGDNYQVAYMDHEGMVYMKEVELIPQEFNEGLTLSAFQPTTKLIDLYGAENMESLGQAQVEEVQHELFLVGVRNPGGHKTPTIWIKHYKNGILTRDEAEEDSEEDEADTKGKGKGK